MGIAVSYKERDLGILSRRDATKAKSRVEDLTAHYKQNGLRALTNRKGEPWQEAVDKLIDDYNGVYAVCSEPHIKVYTKIWVSLSKEKIKERQEKIKTLVKICQEDNLDLFEK